MKTVTISSYHQTFTLHPSGALYWHETDMLLIADVHLGKVSHFRKHGSAVPASVISHNFEKLDEVLAYFQPKVLCFMGDLFHSYLNTEWLLFTQWIEQVSSKIILIAGNHDIISPLQYKRVHVDVTDEWQIGSVLLTHIPEKREHAFNIAGHIHPGVRLQGLGRQWLSVPCFFNSPDQMILPAFGAFTGKYILTPTIHDNVYAITEREVIQVNRT
ncbi:ligase-associated DNA damage response endonuclease PdeM [Aquimarina sp. U1-2]|uniref:ligase-associated DNA damage response endonuclease PdeM n=1 Tax=Aquimarina sp. U1-2 TaxID=2823141 RepID=UPI001AECFDE8|nr:ligase-associated DNA damage response endonuclease PdeM [Aquimarina sp. U1-2]MBP2833230.1 ligase-associated DNA damage response endonuclease PdeM [Aquimarina sp. U1-2]